MNTRSELRDGGLLDVRELRKSLLEVFIAVLGDLVLIGLLSIAREDTLELLEPLGHPSDRREALLVEEGVVTKVDKHLRRSRVGPARGEDNSAAGVGAADGVVLQVRVPVLRVQLWVARETELHDEARDDAEEARICLLYTSPSPRDLSTSRMPSSA